MAIEIVDLPINKMVDLSIVFVNVYQRVWYIYLHHWVIFRANVGKYSIHGAYGN